jgi:hypothetical protein
MGGSKWFERCCDTLKVFCDLYRGGTAGGFLCVVMGVVSSLQRFEYVLYENNNCFSNTLVV